MKNSLSHLLKTRGMRMVDLARELGVDKATVTRWSQKQVPFERLADVERVTGIPAAELRPDLARLFSRQPACQ